MKKITLFTIILLIIFALVTVATGKKALASHAVIFIDESGKIIISQGSVLGEENDDDDEDRNNSESNKKRDDDRDGGQRWESISSPGASRREQTDKLIPDEDQGNDKGEEHQGRVELKSENGETEIKVRSADGTERKLKIKQEEGETLIRLRKEAVRNEVRIKSSQSGFSIEQRGKAAQTQFPLTVDTETNQLIVSTPFGQVNVQVLPAVAIENILAADIVDQVKTTEIIQNPEESDDQNKVVYQVQGLKQVRLLGIMPIIAPITTRVGTATGETISIEKPWYLNLFSFLFKT